MSADPRPEREDGLPPGDTGFDARLDTDDDDDETEVVAHAEPIPWCVGCFG